MSAKHTPGPLVVRVSKKWPFYIETFDAGGKIVFSTNMPCQSSADKTPEQAIDCVNFDHADRNKFAEVNRRAVADDVLRAAAPELLDALQALMRNFPTDFDLDVAGWDAGDIETAMQAHDIARAAISKAQGGAV